MLLLRGWLGRRPGRGGPAGLPRDILILQDVSQHLVVMKEVGGGGWQRGGAGGLWQELARDVSSQEHQICFHCQELAIDAFKHKREDKSDSLVKKVKMFALVLPSANSDHQFGQLPHHPGTSFSTAI